MNLIINLHQNQKYNQDANIQMQHITKIWLTTTKQNIDSTTIYISKYRNI